MEEQQSYSDNNRPWQRSAMIPLTLAVIGLAAGPTGNARGAEQSPAAVTAYINALPAESNAARDARHARVAKNRSDDRDLIMVHRGASRFAPENSLEAYVEAMAHGADGVEIDLRRSADGVLYLFHDDILNRLVKGTGKVKDKTYYQLASLPFLSNKNRPQTRVPTFVAFLALARERDILMHLDVKEPGLQDELIRLFDEADMWDHIVEVNGGNAERIRNHPKVKLRKYKGWFPEIDKPELLKSFMAQEGSMVFLKNDPTPAAKYLQRSGAGDAKLPAGLLAQWQADGTWKILKQVEKP
jgi:hypothetical protein